MAVHSIPDNALRLRLRVAFKLLCGGALVAVAVVALGYLGGGAGERGGAAERLQVAGLEPGSARRFAWEGEAMIVLRRADRDPTWFVAFARGTAMGCPVVWEPARGSFVEPCSGARYDAGGRPIGDPRLAPLRQPDYRVSAEGRLVIE